MTGYVERVVDRVLPDLLKVAGAVVIEGARACGKTETARRHCRSEVLLDVDPQAAQMIAVDPGLILDGPTPRLIDEWQQHPELWNHVRRAVDQRRAPGQFILTGSATPPAIGTRHTGAGRFLHVQMRPMSLLELGRSTGDISLGHLLDGSGALAPDPGLTLDELIAEIVRGGWPATRHLEPADAALIHRGYLRDLSDTELPALDGVRRDPRRVARVMQSLARHVATQAANTTIAADAAQGDTPVSQERVAGYVDALRRVHVIEDVAAWSPHLRSRTTLRVAATRHFVDPSLAAAALPATSDALRADFNTLGLLFESLVVRDLRVYAQAHRAQVFHYRDSSGLEVDAVVDAGDRWAAFEVKLGVGQIDAAARQLLRLRDRIDTTRRGAPSALGVIVGAGRGYVRADGVHVIPIGALGV